MLNLIRTISLLFLVMFAQLVFSQQYVPILDKTFRLKIEKADRSEFRYIPKKPGHYTAEDWRAVIDSTWGEGLPTENKLEIFDLFWNKIDDEYAGFLNIDVNWDSLYNHYRPEVEAGVSRGRFHAIMCRLYYALGDIHTFIMDYIVAAAPLKPGIPLFVHDGYQTAHRFFAGDIEYTHFGAGLEPLPDSSLFVYTVSENHPLGLEKGDIVLGDDGIPWKVLLKELLKAELPFAVYPLIGTSDFSISHQLLTSAGENWHLFDTIDIVKYSSGDTLHLSTGLLNNLDKKVWATSQMPIPGIPFPDVYNDHHISRGIIDGSNIGYIYAWSWYDENFGLSHPAGEDFREAIQILINDYDLGGLIIDSRFNMGGSIKYAKGLSILFNEDQDIFQDNIRADPNDHYSVEISHEGNFKVIADKNTLFDKPIAVLTGPGSMSGGDLMPFHMRYHPMCRSFGLPTNGAFGATFPIDMTFISTDYWMSFYTGTVFSLNERPNEYLNHLSIPADEEIWLTQDDAATGDDTVVKKALDWMMSLSYAHDVKTDLTFTHPQSDSITITAEVENPNSHELSVSSIVLQAENSQADTVLLFDDGLHNDLNASDGLWGAKFLPQTESHYVVSVKTKDITAGTWRQLPKAAHFTTIGPIVIESYEIISTDTIPNPGDRLIFKFTLFNAGQEITASNITAGLSCSEPTLAKVVGNNNAKFGDISANEIGLTNDSLSILISDSIRSSVDIPVTLEISSDGYSFWKDTLLVSVSLPTVIADRDGDLPNTFALFQNYPNPFNPKTVISYQLPFHSNVDLSIFNLVGQKVATLVSEKKAMGAYKIQWDATGFPTGVYIYKIATGSFVQSRKLVLMK